jgi:hypothetical protein
MTIHIINIGKQTTPTSCGAFAFAALALVTNKHALGTTIIHNPIPGDLAFARFAFINKSFTTADATGYALELHNVTGNLYLDPTTNPSEYRYLKRYEPPDYNSPAALVAVAAATPATNITLTIHDKLTAMTIYTREIASITQPRTGKIISHTIDKQFTHAVNANRAFLLAVDRATATTPLPTHWLAFGDDNQYYDPADGTDSNVWNTSTSNQDTKYQYAGIKIEVY